MVKYAVMFEVERGEWMYASGENPFTYNSPPLTFNTKEEARKEAIKYNTGIVVQRDGDIREFSKGERMAAKIRQIANGGNFGY